MNNFGLGPNVLYFKSDCCGDNTPLTVVPQQNCPINMGQIQRVIFAIQGTHQWNTADNTQNLPATIAGNDITAQAGWDILLTAGDTSLITLSPYTTGGGDSTITAGDTVTIGGNDNTTFSGRTIITAVGPAQFQIRLDGLDKDVIKALRDNFCKGNLMVYFVTQCQTIWGCQNGDIVTGHTIYTPFLGTKANEGFGSFDSNLLTFQLDSNYDECNTPFVPEDGFNPLRLTQ
jgi:hypothetical protein